MARTVIGGAWGCGACFLEEQFSDTDLPRAPCDVAHFQVLTPSGAPDQESSDNLFLKWREERSQERSPDRLSPSETVEDPLWLDASSQPAAADQDAAEHPWHTPADDEVNSPLPIPPDPDPHVVPPALITSCVPLNKQVLVPLTQQWKLNSCKMRRDLMPTSAVLPQFAITLTRKSASDKVSVDVDYGDGKTLKVRKVKTGMLSAWNEAFPALLVEAGDSFVQINGKRNDSKALLKELTTAPSLHIIARKAQHRLAEADSLPTDGSRLGHVPHPSLVADSLLNGAMSSTEHSMKPRDMATFPIGDLDDAGVVSPRPHSRCVSHMLGVGSKDRNELEHWPGSDVDICSNSDVLSPRFMSESPRFMCPPSARDYDADSRDSVGLARLPTEDIQVFGAPAGANLQLLVASDLQRLARHRKSQGCWQQLAGLVSWLCFSSADRPQTATQPSAPALQQPRLALASEAELPEEDELQAEMSSTWVSGVHVVKYARLDNYAGYALEEKVEDREEVDDEIDACILDASAHSERAVEIYANSQVPAEKYVPRHSADLLAKFQEPLDGDLQDQANDNFPSACAHAEIPRRAPRVRFGADVENLQPEPEPEAPLIGLHDRSTSYSEEDSEEVETVYI